MSRTPVTKINGELLKLRLQNFPLERRVISRALGRSEKYLTNCISSGYIATDALELLETLYGINGLRIEAPEVATPTEEKTSETIDYKKLGEVIEDALFCVLEVAFDRFQKLPAIPVYKANIDKAHTGDIVPVVGADGFAEFIETGYDKKLDI